MITQVTSDNAMSLSMQPRYFSVPSPAVQDSLTPRFLKSFTSEALNPKQPRTLNPTSCIISSILEQPFNRSGDDEARQRREQRREGDAGCVARTLPGASWVFGLGFRIQEFGTAGSRVEDCTGLGDESLERKYEVEAGKFPKSS